MASVRRVVIFAVGALLTLSVTLTVAAVLAGTAVAAPPGHGAEPSAGATARPAGVVPRPAARPFTTKGYTYWGYYRWDPGKHTWAYMPVGANSTKQLPADGSVYGFRWALVVKEPRLPRAAGSFSAICGNQTAPAGRKRVALIVDFGTAADDPGGGTPPTAEGLCAVVPTADTVQQALESVTPVRTAASGLICGIGGYPANGCGSTVANAKEDPADRPVTLRLVGASQASSGGGLSSGGIAAIVVACLVVLALGAGTLLLRRRRA
ncbi:MAG TPA: SCO2322 family protein [Nocardioidaceae bacterium]|nr:SCO2322 family protein [Nocardioidaceae bacterium]